VIYLRIEEYTPDEPGRMVEQLLRDQKIDFAHALTVLDKTGIRQRKY
jgi:hypothetical protein